MKNIDYNKEYIILNPGLSIAPRLLANRITGIPTQTIAEKESIVQRAASEVQDYVKSGQLGADTAVHISKLDDERRQEEVAEVVG